LVQAGCSCNQFGYTTKFQLEQSWSNTGINKLEFLSDKIFLKFEIYLHSLQLSPCTLVLHSFTFNWYSKRVFAIILFGFAMINHFSDLHIHAKVSVNGGK